MTRLFIKINQNDTNSHTYAYATAIHKTKIYIHKLHTYEYATLTLFIAYTLSFIVTN